MKTTLEQLFIATRTARLKAGDTLNLAHSAALAAVHRAGMEDAAGIAASFRDGRDGYIDVAKAIELAIRRAAGEP